MGIFLVALSLVLAGALLAYGEELAALARDRGEPAGVLVPALVDASGTVPNLEAGNPTHLLDSLVKDLESPDARRRDRALASLPNYPPRVLARRLVPRLEGPATEAKDRIADLLLRHGGEEVLEPLHRYFLGRVAGLEAEAEDPVAPLVGGRRKAVAREAGSRSGRLIRFPEPGEARARAARSESAPVPSGESGGAVVRLHREPIRPDALAPGAVPFDAGVLDPEPALRAKAMAALPGSGHPHGFELLSRSLRGDPEPMVRAASAVALADLGPACQEISALCEATRDADVSVRWNACYALGRLGRGEAKVALRRAENDADGSVRLAARKALEALGLDPPLVAVLREPETRGA